MFKLVVVAVLIVTLSACSMGLLRQRIGLAHELARSSGLIYEEIHAKSYRLATFSKGTDPSMPLRVYIEGDGFAWRNRFTPSLNPTPKNPVALKLASVDDHANVLYIARPCQYINLDQSGCDVKDWTSQRFHPDVIESINDVITHIKQRYGMNDIELIGFSGGANIAAWLTATRRDVRQLMTVAGNLDHEALHLHHKVSQLDSENVNAIEVAGRGSHIPQLHIVGTNDHVVPEFIAQRYMDESSHHQCTEIRRIKGYHHQSPWEVIWPDIIRSNDSWRKKCIH